jgi:hypothetical protein
MFNMLERTYDIGLNPGQLSAPPGLKIAMLAIVMEKRAFISSIRRAEILDTRYFYRNII